MNHDVFISYSSKNTTEAQDICHELEKNGIKCWMAPRDIIPGKDFGDLIDDAILSCRIFVLVYSANSLSSQWCKGELNIAFTERKTIIPYRIDSAPLKGAMRVILNHTHWIDAYPDYKACFNELVAVAKETLGKSKPIEEVTPTPQPIPTPNPTPKPNNMKHYWWVVLCVLVLGVAIWRLLPEKSAEPIVETEIIPEQVAIQTEANSELEELRAEKARIEKENEALKQNNEELQNSNTELKNSNSNLQKNISDIKAKEAQNKAKATQAIKSSTPKQNETKSAVYTQNTTTTSTQKIEQTTEQATEQATTTQKAETKEVKKDNSYLLKLPDSEFIEYKEKGMYGYKLKSTGEVVISAKYTQVGSFIDGIASVYIDDKGWSFIDKTGKEVTP